MTSIEMVRREKRTTVEGRREYTVPTLNIQDAWESTPIRCKIFASCTVAWAIAFLVMFICSFKYVSELQYCIRYSTISQKVDSDLYNSGMPGSYFIGVDHNFICYPRNRARLVYADLDEETKQRRREEDPSTSFHPPFETRTKEGLPLRMDVTVEYILKGDKIPQLFTLTGRDYLPLVATTIFGALQNVASKFNAEAFIGEERHIVALAMGSAANATATVFHAEVLRVHLFHIDLPDLYENTIAQIHSLKLEQNKALELRALSLVQERNKFIKASLLLQTDIAEKLIDIDKQIETAKLKQAGDLTTANTEALVLQEHILRDRELAVIELEREIALVKKYRQGNVSIALNNKARAFLRYEKELLEAKAMAKVKEVNTEGLSIETVQNGSALAVAEKYDYAAKLKLYKALLLSANMSVGETIQYAWVQAINGAESSDIFLDYKKVPLLAEDMA
jgi:hypothetical protein